MSNDIESHLRNRFGLKITDHVWFDLNIEVKKHLQKRLNHCWFNLFWMDNWQIWHQFNHQITNKIEKTLISE